MNKRDAEEPETLRDVITANSRGWNSFWAWRDKPMGELEASRDILRAAGMTVVDLQSREAEQDPPDCEATVDGKWTGVEVTELVCEKTLARSLKAQRERAAGKEPKKPEAYRVWEKSDFVNELQNQITRKDKATLKGGPYEQYILVIHTDEYLLDVDHVSRFLEGTNFYAEMITHVLLGLSYDPSVKRCPIFCLPLRKRSDPLTTPS
jgi:hypothetical protein